MVKGSKVEVLGQEKDLAKSREVFQGFKRLRDNNPIFIRLLLFMCSKSSNKYMSSNYRSLNFFVKINMLFT